MRTPGVLALLAVSAVVAGCSHTTSAPPAGGPSTPSGPPAALVSAPTGVAVAGGSTAQQVAAAVSAALFVSAPVVVVIAPGDPAALASGTTAATELGMPLLLADPPATQTPAGTTPAGTPPVAQTPSTQTTTTGVWPAASSADREIHRLGARTVLTVGAVAPPPGVRVVAASGDSAAEVHAAVAKLPATSRPDPLGETTVLVRTGTAVGAETAAAPLARATAQAAGAAVVAVGADDPRTDGAAIAALTRRPTGPVLAAGSGFGPVPVLTRRLATARAGVQLPGGGQVMFPGRALVALYGVPDSPSLGVLGEQGVAASVARAARVAAPYRSLYPVPVVPTFEIIATVADSAPGRDGDYSGESTPAALEPLIDAATQAGMYVVLDLQPGRASALDQAKRYASLLRKPNVGLALDPEWALRPGQLPLRQIGSLDAAQINPVIHWLSDLTAQANLPQKMLVLHQFRLSMISHESQLATHDDEVAVVIHVDGQGPRAQKEDTWRVIANAAPAGVQFGWKNFYDEDPQLASPTATVKRIPRPVMVSYQ